MDYSQYVKCAFINVQIAVFQKFSYQKHVALVSPIQDTCPAYCYHSALLLSIEIMNGWLHLPVDCQTLAATDGTTIQPRGSVGCLTADIGATTEWRDAKEATESSWTEIIRFIFNKNTILYIFNCGFSLYVTEERSYQPLAPTSHHLCSFPSSV